MTGSIHNINLNNKSSFKILTILARQCAYFNEGSDISPDEHNICIYLTLDTIHLTYIHIIAPNSNNENEYSSENEYTKTITFKKFHKKPIESFLIFRDFIKFYSKQDILKEAI